VGRVIHRCTRIRRLRFFGRDAGPIPSRLRGATLEWLNQSKPRAALQTFHALQATDLASAFNDALRRLRIQPGDYAAELTAPEGPSTAGGVQAMQHLRLISSQPGAPTLVVGHANHAEGRAELRTFEHLDAVHRQRFRRPLTIDRTQYDDFVRFAKQLLEALHLETALVGPPLDLELDDEAGSASSTGSAGRWIFALLVGVVILAAAGFGAWRLGLLKTLTGG
jgi:hypothetical protein